MLTHTDTTINNPNPNPNYTAHPNPNPNPNYTANRCPSPLMNPEMTAQPPYYESSIFNQSGHDETRAPPPPPPHTFTYNSSSSSSSSSSLIDLSSSNFCYHNVVPLYNESPPAKMITTTHIDDNQSNTNPGCLQMSPKLLVMIDGSDDVHPHHDSLLLHNHLQHDLMNPILMQEHHHHMADQSRAIDPTMNMYSDSAHALLSSPITSNTPPRDPISVENHHMISQDHMVPIVENHHNYHHHHMISQDHHHMISQDHHPHQDIMYYIDK